MPVGHVEVQAVDGGDGAVALDDAAQADRESVGGHGPASHRLPDACAPALSSVAMSSQYVFTMHRLTKAYPPDKTVLSDVTLAFYPGAKIGVLGYNGAGKSSLLQDHGRARHGLPRRRAARHRRDRRPARAGAPARPPARPCASPSRTASPRRRRCSTASTSSRPTTPTRRPRSSRDLQAKIDAADAWNLDTALDYAMDALRCPPADADVDELSGGERRRVALCRLLLRQARPAAARRADEPPRRRVGRLARAAPRRVRGRRRRRHPRSLLPRQRRRLDPRARPRQGHPVRGQLLELARAEAEAPPAGGEGREERARRRSPRSSSGCARTPRAARRSRRRA